MPLHTDYRPDTLQSFVGNTDTKEALNRLLKRPSPPPTFLFTGPSGTGKTTLGRIVKNVLNCDNTDFTELNASDDRGIGAVRELIKKMYFSPLGGDKKVFLIDEAHMLTKEAQEALLKSLEEPPKYVHFCVCTTNPEALKTTFKRRCHHFELSPLSNAEIGSLLKTIAKKEKRRGNADVFSKIIELSEGSAGQALKLLDQVIDMMKEPERAIGILRSSGASESEVIDICRVLTNTNMNEGTKWSKVKKIIKEVKNEPEAARRAILGYLHSVLLNTGDARIYYMMEEFKSNYYDSGKAGLTMSCFAAIYGGGDE